MRLRGDGHGLCSPEVLAETIKILAGYYFRTTCHAPVEVFDRVEIDGWPRPWAVLIGSPYPLTHACTVAIWPARRRVQTLDGTRGRVRRCYRYDATDQLDEPAYEDGRLSFDRAGGGGWGWSSLWLAADAVGAYARQYVRAEVERATSDDWPDVLDGADMVVRLRDRLAHLLEPGN